MLINAMEITKEDSFECAIRYVKLGHNPIVLDFASSTNPGGGWRGKQVGTQEESLCRRSNLGILLESKKYPIPTDGQIYIKDCVINKDINMNLITPIKCGVIASELKAISERTYAYLESRIDAFYEVGIKNNHSVIILGAIGCDAFKESNDDVLNLARMMKICATKYQHKILSVFAIYKGKENYKVFVDVFANKI